MTTYVTKAEVQKLIAEAKESLNVRITELVKRCNLIEAEVQGDIVAVKAAEVELAEIREEIARLEAQGPTPEPVPDILDGSTLAAYVHEGGPVEEVSAPDGSGDTVFAFECSNTSGTEITDNPRCQLRAKATLPQEFWWSGAFWLPTSFPANVAGWWNLLEGPYGPPYAGSPPVSIQATNTVLQWIGNSTVGSKVQWQKAFTRGKKLGYLIHVRQSAKKGEAGLVEMWLNGEQVCSKAVPTLDASNFEGPQALYLQSYRAKDLYPGTMTVYHWPMKVGTTRESVGG